MNKNSLDVQAQLFNSDISTSNRNISKAFRITDLHEDVQQRKENVPARTLAKFRFVATVRYSQ